MRILVTGCAGFIGYALCNRLLAAGHNVLGIDNYLTGSRQHVRQLQTQTRFQFLAADISQVLPSLDRVEQIYNLACAASPPHYQRDPIHTWKTSTLGVLQLLEIAERMEAVFLQASTSEVYGDPLQHPQRENYWGHVNPIGPRACYDEGKRAAESLCMDFHRQRGVKIKIARIFNTYGPNMDPKDGRVVSNFITQALQDKPLTIYGDGKQTRSFCYVDDLVDGLIRLMESAPPITGPINLGNPDEFTMLELIQLIEQELGRELPVVQKPLPVDDPKLRRPDIALAKRDLGWQPKTPLHVGLPKTITYFQSVLGVLPPLVQNG